MVYKSLKFFIKKIIPSSQLNFYKDYNNRRKSIGAKVLFYHGVEFNIKNENIQTLHMRFDLFEKQILYLKNNFEIISLDDLNSCIINGHKIKKDFIILTFDDGYKNNLDVVYPFLKSQNIPFSVFVSTNHISTGDLFPIAVIRIAFFNGTIKNIYIPVLNKSYDLSTLENAKKAAKEANNLVKYSSYDLSNKIINQIIDSFSKDLWKELIHKYDSEMPMSWKEVDELYKGGVIIGAHSHDHYLLGNFQTKNFISDQYSQSYQLIKNRYGSCKYMCYPNGQFNDISKESYELSKKYYELAFITHPGELTSSNDRIVLPRIFAPEKFEQFKNRINCSSLTNEKYKSKYNNFMNSI